jgi:hypothetical protein
MNSNKENEIPIIIFHLGNQEYVRLCLRQASKFNKNIVILCDNPNNYNVPGIQAVNYLPYSKYIQDFQKLYKHFSTNSAQLEFLCIIRWFVVYEYMKEQNIARAFICDSDVLIYENITEINEKYLKKWDFMICSSHSKDVSGAQSIWDFKKLQEFVIFCFKFYKTQIANIEKWHKTYKEPGGFCDMTLLYYFAHNRPDFVGLKFPDLPLIENDLTQVFDDEITFDLHLATFGNHQYPEQYERDPSTGNKLIKYRDGKPYCFNKRLNKDVRFVLLHFQGRNKMQMKNYYEIK